MRRSLLAIPLVLLSAWLLAPAAHAADKVVPDVVGLPLEPAREALERAGCTVEVRYQAGPPAGHVYSQTPGGLTPLKGSVAVTVWVGGTAPAEAAPGPDPDAPPSGGPPSGGDGDLPPTGLPPTGTGPGDPGPGLPPSDGPPPMRPTPDDPPPVDPFAGDPPPDEGMGSELALPADREPSTQGPQLPSVLGQPEAGARRALAGWRVRVEHSPGVPTLVGQVINQSPFAGRPLAPGEEVTIVVAVAGAPDRTWRIAPKATGQAMEEAARAIRAAGFVPELRSVRSAPADAGRVVSQTPLPGSLQRLGEVVVLRVGRGAAASLSRPGATGTPPGPATPDAGGPAPGPAPAPEDPDAPPSGAGDSPLPPGPGPEPGPLPEPPAPGPDTPTPPPSPPREAVRLGATRLVSPPPGESYPWRYGADFEWTPVKGALTYEWELEEELPSGAWQASDAQSFAGTTYRPKTLPRGRYRWRVRAVAGEDKGEWSPWQRLYMY